MLSVEEIIDKIRTTVHDEQETGYDDEVVLGYINDAVRVLRRTIMQIRPELLALPPFTGKLAAGESSVSLGDEKIIRIIRVVAGDRVLAPCRIEKIGAKSGTPEGYYLTGFNVINFYPVPSADIDYTIVIIPDNKLLGFGDNSPFPLDIDDFVYEYAAARAQITNEYDMSQETQLVQMINSQVEDYLRNIDRKPIFTQGYWNNANNGAAYGGRRSHRGRW